MLLAWFLTGRRVVSDVWHARSETKRVVRRLALLFLFTVVVTLVFATGMYLLEVHDSTSDIRTYGDAVFWTASQLLSLGSAMDNPVTTGGRVLSIVLDAYAVIVIGTLSGSLGALFLHRIDERLTQRETGEDDPEGAGGDPKEAGGDPKEAGGDPERAGGAAPDPAPGDPGENPEKKL